MDRFRLSAEELDGYVKPEDKEHIVSMNIAYDEVLKTCKALTAEGSESTKASLQQQLIDLFAEMGHKMQDIVAAEPNIHVYSFDTPKAVHGEVSRLIAKLRDVRTEKQEFIYYIQRAYELLFNYAFGSTIKDKKNYLIVKTPVTEPVPNFAVHKIPNIDARVENTVMCVMLRGALLPCMIMSKEIQEYSSDRYVTPFALFNIHRDDTKKEHTMEYILDLKSSYFKPEMLDGRDLIFADPMNATGGSLVTIVNYLRTKNIKPKSIQFFNVVSSLKAALRIVRAVKEAQVYTLWMDPVVNNQAYILPGLGDAGDRINGPYREGASRHIIQLIADYGAHISDLYRAQIQKIEETVLHIGGAEDR
jgi:uracil phosphoribosyltransferase